MGAQKTTLEEAIRKEWKKRWENIIDHKNTKFFYGGPNKKKAKGILSMSRGNLSLFIKAITGHNFLSKHQNRIGQPIAPECRLCEEEPEMFIHLLTKCPRLAQARQDIFLDNIPNTHSDWKMGKLKKIILTTVVHDMLTEKDNYTEQQIMHITHTYSSSADSD